MWIKTWLLLHGVCMLWFLLSICTIIPSRYFIWLVKCCASEILKKFLIACPFKSKGSFHEWHVTYALHFPMLGIFFLRTLDPNLGNLRNNNKPFFEIFHSLTHREHGFICETRIKCRICFFLVHLDLLAYRNNSLLLFKIWCESS